MNVSSFRFPLHLLLAFAFCQCLALGQVNYEDSLKLNKQYRDLAAAHKPAIKEAAKSTVGVYVGDELACLGSVVRADGWVLTKNSEVEDAMEDSDEALEIHYGPEGKKSASAWVATSFPKMDLALLKVEAKGLKPLKWHTGKDPVLGSFLASPGHEDDNPIAIGVLSVENRSLDESERGYLGIYLDTNEDGDGILVERVQPDTAAASAGMKDGDIIVEMNGKSYDAVPEFIEAVARKKADEVVKLKIKRGDDTLRKDVKLGKRPPANPRGGDREGRFDRMNRMGTDLSEVLAGFPSAIQHDLPLDPEQCGGPLCDLDGRVLGINIARAGRVKTYTLPGREISKALKDLDWKALAVPPSKRPKDDPSVAGAVPPKGGDGADGSKGEGEMDLASIRAELVKTKQALAEARKALEGAEAANARALKALDALKK